MVKLTCFLFCPLLFLACKPSNDLLEKKNKFHFQSLFSSEARTDISCYRIPALIATANGQLVAAIDERVPSCNDLRSNPDINIVLRTSDDYGATWSDIQRVIDYPIGQSASDPSFIYDSIEGILFMFYNFMDLENAPNEYFLKVVRSKDHGNTWSKPEDITDQITKADWKKDFKFITSGKGMQTKKGKLVHTLVNLDKGLHLFASDDQGQSWYLMDLPIQPGDESKIIELSNGNWMINSRVNKSGLRYVHLSNDQGESWNSYADSTLIDPSCNASIINYQQGLLFSNANSSDSRTNLGIRISKDEGQTWSSAQTIYENGSAYSSMCVLDKNAVGVFFEKDDYKDNVFVRIEGEFIN